MKTSLASEKMNLLVLRILVIVLIFGFSSAYAQDPKNTATPESTPPLQDSDLKTDIEKVSYLLGAQLGDYHKLGIDIDMDLLLRGFKDSLGDKPPVFKPFEAQQIMINFHIDMRNRQKLGVENMWKVNLEKPQMMTFDAGTDYYWILETNKGTIKIKLMPDVAPMHVTSTIFLTKKGFYDNLKFHRVIPNFMAQGGCPYGVGNGGPGYTYDGEFRDDVTFDRPYLLAMANAGPGTDGSQFFITCVPTKHLNGKHTIFGEVSEGQDVVKTIESLGSAPRGETKEEIKIIKAAIEEVKK